MKKLKKRLEQLFRRSSLRRVEGENEDMQPGTGVYTLLSLIEGEEGAAWNYSLMAV